MRRYLCLVSSVSAVLTIAGCSALIGLDATDYNVAGDAAAAPSGDAAPIADPGNVPIEIDSDPDGYTTCVLLARGQVYCWGGAQHGQLGTGDVTSDAVRKATLVPTDAEGGSFDHITQISASYDHACALKGDGSVYCWGKDEFGQVGTVVAGGDVLRPTRLASVPPLRTVVAGGDRTCGIDQQGGVLCWGYNWESGLGHTPGQNGDVQCRNGYCNAAPVAVAGLTGAVSLALGAYHACALDANGVACFGSDNEGPSELGEPLDAAPGERAQSAAPVRLSVPAAERVIAGRSFNCALQTGGVATCWGNNAEGQLAQGTATNPMPPSAFDTAKSVPTIADAVAGLAVMVVADKDGALWTVGYNEQGELGIGVTGGDTICGYWIGALNASNCYTTLRRVAPPAGAAALKAKKLAAGAYHACVIDSADDVYCWGDNSKGQLGDGTITNSPRPVRVVGLPPAH